MNIIEAIKKEFKNEKKRKAVFAFLTKENVLALEAEKKRLEFVLRQHKLGIELADKLDEQHKDEYLNSIRISDEDLDLITLLEVSIDDNAS